ncbi:MAG TPA: hypothetical protein VK195_14960 [Burkholderiaceae bacterium]|nr:hypothetical protein [Burkholderiaceae bacterium]
MRTLLFSLALLIDLLIALPAFAAEPLQKHGIVLMQTESDVQSRVPSVDAMANYIRAVEQAANDHLSTLPQGQPMSGYIVIAVRGQQLRSWLSLVPQLPDDGAAALKAAIDRVMPFRAKDGPVVFAISVGIWGGPPPQASAPNPPEFRAATKAAGRPLEIGELVERIWND